MCGINGIVTLAPGAASSLEETRAAAVQRVARMNARLAHRGPDADGIEAQGPAVLGHKRLAIIDLSDAGKQPMVSACGRYHLVYNGELYNYRALRSALDDYPFATQTDSEVLLAAFARWGIECLSRLNGMFGFAVWDAAEQRLWVARDRLGIKPVYYHHHAGDGVLAFSSELRALLASGLVRPELDPEGLCEYLRYQTVMAPRTIVSGVSMLRPGEWLRFDRQGLERRRYYRLTDAYNPAIAGEPEGVVLRRVRDLLAGAVERRLVADVPFGAFLSGGIDSSALVALMAGELGHKTRTFSVVFDEAEYDEAPYARTVAKRFGTDHSEIHLRADDFLEALPDALAAMDHPSGDGPNTYVVARATKAAGVTMALSGLGGDELFAGYEVFRRARHLRFGPWLARLPLALRKATGEVLRRARPGMATGKLAALLASPQLDLAEVYPLARRSLLDAEVSSLLGARALPADAFAAEVRALLAPEHGGRFPFLSQVSFGEISGYMQNTLLRDTDQMTMAHALEVRVPLLDHHLAEYVLNTADTCKLGETPKPLLVKALGSMLPREIVERPKMGFGLPFAPWMRGPLRAYSERCLASVGRVPGIDPVAVERLFQAFLAGSPQVTWSRVYTLVALGAWVEANLNSEPVRATPA